MQEVTREIEITGQIHMGIYFNFQYSQGSMLNAVDFFRFQPIEKKTTHKKLSDIATETCLNFP